MKLVVVEDTYAVAARVLDRHLQFSPKVNKLSLRLQVATRCSFTT